MPALTENHRAEVLRWKKRHLALHAGLEVMHREKAEYHNREAAVLMRDIQRLEEGG